MHDPRIYDGVTLTFPDPTRRAELAARIWKHVDMPRAGATRRCWPWRAGVTASGEPRLQLDARRSALVRRIVFVLYNMPPDGGLSSDDYILTRCGRLTCLRPDHLEAKRVGDFLAEQRPHAHRARLAQAARVRAVA
jgi:hypothetical protein